MFFKNNLLMMLRVIIASSKLKKRVMILHCNSLKPTVMKMKVVLEEYDLDAMPTPEVLVWAVWIAGRLFPNQPEWQATFLKRFAILPEDLFNHLTETGTEVVTRVRIDEETGIVADGQLWTEESLPIGTILLGMIACDPREGAQAQALLETYASGEKNLQFGGKASVGRGRIRCVFGNP